MHEDNYLIAVSHLHNDQTDGNLLKDQTEDTLILKFIYGNILELKSKLKLSNMFAYGKLISLHSSLPFRTDNRLEDRRQ